MDRRSAIGGTSASNDTRNAAETRTPPIETGDLSR
jgi:hypothetical protein